jgi:hypothetical protein
MSGKKGHKPRIAGNAGMHGVHQRAAGRKSSGETEGRYMRDRKRGKGPYGSAGNSPLIQK